MDNEDYAHEYQQGTIPPHGLSPLFDNQSPGASIPAALQGEISENGMCRLRGNCRGLQSLLSTFDLDGIYFPLFVHTASFNLFSVCHSFDSWLRFEAYFIAVSSHLVL